MTTEIKSCTCEHEYQDEKYGKKKRVHNSLHKKNIYNWKCTVCGAMKR